MKQNKNVPKNAGHPDGWTKMDNRFIRSKHYTAHDKIVLMAIASCNPSFPSYSKIQEWTGLSRPTIAKSLRRLERGKIIYRYKEKNGQKIYYETAWTSKPSELVSGELVKLTFKSSKAGLPELVNEVYSIKTKEKELKRESFFETGDQKDQPTLTGASEGDNWVGDFNGE